MAAIPEATWTVVTALPATVAAPLVSLTGGADLVDRLRRLQLGHHRHAPTLRRDDRQVVSSAIGEAAEPALADRLYLDSSVGLRGFEPPTS